MRSRHFLLVACGAAVLQAAAPAVAGKKEMDILQADVDEIQRQVFDLKRLVEKQHDDFQRLLGFLEASPDARKQMAEFNANVEALRGEIRALATRFDATSEGLSTLERRVASACHGPAAAPDSPVPGAAGGDAAQAAFQQAYGDYIKDSFDLAVQEFRDFISKHPESDLADNAQYWIAMSHFNQRQHEEAILGFDQLLTRWPSAENAPEAIYRKGLALLELNRLGQGVLVLNDVVSKYAGTQAATQAAARLRELASGQR